MAEVEIVKALHEAGAIITAYSPTSLEQFAADCLTLAGEAETEAEKPTPDDEYVNSRVLTIESLIPGYRTAAGIE